MMSILRPVALMALAGGLAISSAGCSGGSTSPAAGGEILSGKKQGVDSSQNEEAGSARTETAPVASSESLDHQVAIALNHQRLPSLKFLPGTGNSLAVWNDHRESDTADYAGWAVFGQLVGDSGQVHGDNFVISPPGVEYRSASRIAHDADSAKSLVVWETIQGDILGRMVHDDGTLGSDILALADSPVFEAMPALAFDPVRGRYLVSWIDTSNDFQIQGRLFDRDGRPVSEVFLVSEIPSGKLDLQASADPQSGRFLTVWRDYRGVDVYSIRGQLIGADGGLAGGEIIIADAIGFQIIPAVAYDSNNGCFLVAWSDEGGQGGGLYEIFGRLVASDGVLLTSTFQISPFGGHPHDVVFAASLNQYLLSFSKHGGRIHAQVITSDGLVGGQDFPISDTEGMQITPASSYHPGAGRLMTVWADHRNGTSDIYGRSAVPLAPPASCAEGMTEEEGGCLECEREAGALVDAACPVDGEYSSHGDYLGCVTQVVKQLRSEGRITSDCALKLIDPRARSEVGNS